MYTYKAEVLDVIDGDTLKLKVSLGFYVHVEVSGRLLGINTHEIKGVPVTSEEYRKGMIEKAFVQDWVKQHAPDSMVLIKSVKPDKYAGRWDVHVYKIAKTEADMEVPSLTAALIQANMYKDIPTY